jgi:hypothetical protein
VDSVGGGERREYVNVEYVRRSERRMARRAGRLSDVI